MKINMKKQSVFLLKAPFPVWVDIGMQKSEIFRVILGNI